MRWIQPMPKPIGRRVEKWLESPFDVGFQLGNKLAIVMKRRKRETVMRVFVTGPVAYEQPRKPGLSAPAKIDFISFSITVQTSGRSLQPGKNLCRCEPERVTSS